MIPFKRIGVCLNDEPGDIEALEFAGLVARVAGADRLWCIHVPGLEDREIRASLEPDAVRAGAVRHVPSGLAGRFDVEVRPASGAPEVIAAAIESRLDLLVVGRRLPTDPLSAGSALYSVVRKAPCSVLFPPVHARPHLSRLVVLVEDPEHSRTALEAALHLARSTGALHPQVVAQAVFSVGYGYHYAGQTRAQAMVKRQQMLRDRVVRLTLGLDTEGVNFEIVCTCSDDPAAALIEFATARNMDAVVLANPATTLPASLLLGGTVKNAVTRSPLPVLLIRPMGNTISLLDAVLSTTV